MPVVEARGIADLDSLVVPSLKAAFYVNASSGNGSLVRFQHLTHIYLGHGDSDKPPSYNPTHASGDFAYSAGEGDAWPKGTRPGTSASSLSTTTTGSPETGTPPVTRGGHPGEYEADVSRCK